MLISEVSLNDLYLVPKTHRDQKILLMLSPGAFEFGFQSSSFKRITYDGGEAILVPRHMPLWTRGIGAKFVAVSISDGSLMRAAGQTTEVELQCSCNMNNPPISALMTTIHTEMKAGFPHGQLFLDSLEQALANALLLRQATQAVTKKIYRGGLSPARLRNVIEFVQAHLDCNLTLEVLAKTADLSTSYFCQMFFVLQPAKPLISSC
jgi:AraC family transcriptional regulator